MENVISCRNLQKSYGSHQVLDGVNLEVPVGKIFALLGTNGAGKTTLIRTILGLIPKSSGDVSVLGSEPYLIGPQLRQRIGYVSEEQGLYGWMTIKQLIEFCKSLYENWNEKIVADYLMKFQLTPEDRIKTLSKGQSVKLALILAMAPEPDLLILDEPMTGLDPLAQHEFLQVVMKEISLEGRTIFFSTHNLNDVETAAHHVAILHNGIIQVAGPLSEVCRRIIKLKLPADSVLPASCKKVFTLSENTVEKILLVPVECQVELKSVKHITIVSTDATLEEAFLFFCSGGGRI
jgi:ABC-2 type transport system ATP-binding protein